MASFKPEEVSRTPSGDTFVKSSLQASPHPLEAHSVLALPTEDRKSPRVSLRLVSMNDSALIEQDRDEPHRNLTNLLRIFCSAGSCRRFWRSCWARASVPRRTSRRRRTRWCGPSSTAVSSRSRRVSRSVPPGARTPDVLSAPTSDGPCGEHYAEHAGAGLGELAGACDVRSLPRERL